MLKTNLERIFDEIKDGNNLGEKITLVGATKMVSADVINNAVKLGLTTIAENKVQEFRDKYPLISGANHHFIGHLQTNKVKYLVGKVSLIQSVDSIHLAEEIDKIAKRTNTVQNVLLEINVGGELSKSGFNFDSAEESILYVINNFSSIKVKGLMAMLPKTDDEQTLKELCLKMRALFDKFKELGYEFNHLSIGTSGDYKIAIKYGSNMIRLGRNIFGERNYGEKR